MLYTPSHLRTYTYETYKSVYNILLTFFLTLLHVRALHSRVACETCPDSCHRLRELLVSHFLSLEAKEVGNQADDEILLYFCQGATIENAYIDQHMVETGSANQMKCANNTSNYKSQSMFFY